MRPIIRRTASALAGLALLPLALTACSSDSTDNDVTKKTPTATPVPNPTPSAAPAQRIKPMPLLHQITYRVRLGAKNTNGSYRVTYRFGDLTKFRPNISASTYSAVQVNNTDTVLGSGCKDVRANERAIPFTFSMQGLTGNSDMVHVWLVPVLKQGEKEISPPQGTVRVEYTGFQGGPQCNRNAAGNPTSYGFYGPTTTRPNSPSDITGWIILSGKALDPKAGYKLAVISSAFTSGVAANTVDQIKGGDPYRTQLATGRGSAIAGASVPLVSAGK